ncbi:MAG: diguanylate cyclase [Gammaproteobacteria bacterium]|nr:diguanylate cyclase [Gammaproteobacteria bacterium]
MTTRPIILIVDDEPVNIQVLAASLKDKYLIKVATSGSKCLEISKSEPVLDLILLDIEMPDMNGYEVCRQLKANDKTESVPIIFVTGKSDEIDEEMGLRAGAVDYITKPVRSAIVSARVDTHITLKLQRDKLQDMALHDQLTALYNRHYLLEVADQKVAQAERHEHDLSVLMMDIDHFKTINDSHGHHMGDVVLQEVAVLLKKKSRQEDVAARFGGEEFVMLLEGCDLEVARNRAEELRQAIESLKPRGIDIAISIGVAQLRVGDEDFDHLLKRADRALYQAKQSGRNGVTVAC